MPTTIRTANLDDIPAITAIYAHHVLTACASFEETAPDNAEMGRRMDAVFTNGFPYLVAEEDRHVVGYAYANFHRPRSAYRFTAEDSIYVDARQLGRGIGRALLTRLLAESEQAGTRQMVAVIGDSLNTGSIRLHAALGFSPIGVMPSVGFKLGRWVDCVLMQRSLGPGDTTTPR